MGDERTVYTKYEYDRKVKGYKRMIAILIAILVVGILAAAVMGHVQRNIIYGKLQQCTCITSAGNIYPLVKREVTLYRHPDYPIGEWYFPDDPEDNDLKPIMVKFSVSVVYMNIQIPILKQAINEGWFDDLIDKYVYEKIEWRDEDGLIICQKSLGFDGASISMEMVVSKINETTNLIYKKIDDLRESYKKYEILKRVSNE